MVRIGLTVLLLLFVTSASAQPFTLSTKLENTWRWLAPEGAPANYSVEKFLSGEWTVIMSVPHEIDAEGYVSATIVSPSPEIYKIRVTALDAAGNPAAPSPESDWLFVFPAVTGRPMVVE